MTNGTSSRQTARKPFSLRIFPPHSIHTEMACFVCVEPYNFLHKGTSNGCREKSTLQSSSTWCLLVDRHIPHMYASTWRTTLAVCLPSFLPSCPNQLNSTINNAVVIITLSASARPSLRASFLGVILSRPLKLSRLVTICLTRRDRGSERERERERGREGGREGGTCEQRTRRCRCFIRRTPALTNSGMRKWGGRGRM